jgi:hypothetical protein
MIFGLGSTTGVGTTVLGQGSDLAGAGTKKPLSSRTTGPGQGDDLAGAGTNNTLSSRAGVNLGFDLKGSLAAIGKWVDDMDSEDEEEEEHEKNVRFVYAFIVYMHIVRRL